MIAVTQVVVSFDETPLATFKATSVGIAHPYFQHHEITSS
jgi:hypothetical protein